MLSCQPGLEILEQRCAEGVLFQALEQFREQREVVGRGIDGGGYVQGSGA